MKKYRVYGTYLESLFVDVEADSEEQAEIQGQDLMFENFITSAGSPITSYCDGSVEVVEVEEK